MAKAGHWDTEKTVCGLKRRKSGDLLEGTCFVDPGSGETGGDTAETRLRQFRILPQLFLSQCFFSVFCSLHPGTGSKLP